MAEISTQRDRLLVDYTGRDYEMLRQALREQIPILLPEWKDYQSEADFGNVLLELFAHMADILNYYIDRVAGESFLATAQTRYSVIQHLRLIGYVLSTAAPASASLSLNVPAAFSGKLTINRGDAFATKSGKNTPSVRFEYNGESPLVIDFATISSSGGRKHFTGIPVEEGRLIGDELLGISNNTPNQQFVLAHPRVILRSQDSGTSRDISLTTTLAGKEPERWTRRETLAFSHNNQQDYVVMVDEDDRAVIVFGDGAFGAIPPNGAEIRAAYRVGGGVLGNVAANTIQTIIGAPALAQAAAKVTNPAPATGGADRESIEHAIRHAPSVFRSLRRAVTTQDYEALARDFRGVGKVRAQPLNWNKVVLYVAPQGGGRVSDVLRQQLLAYFEDKRPMTTLIDIADVQYVNIYVTATIGVRTYYDPKEVKAQCEQVAAALLAFDAVDFRQTIYLSKFYEALEGVEGVDHVVITEFRREDERTPIQPQGKIELGVNEIPKAPLVADPDKPDKPGTKVYPAGVQIRVEGES
jgi:hypothetical protein